MEILLVIGRVLFAAIFLVSGIGHLTQADGMSQYATSKGVPAAKAGVIGSGLLAIVGALMLALGVYPDLGALLLIVFLLPVTFFMHAFWKETDPQAKQLENISFMKNLALIGAALVMLVLFAEYGVDAGILDETLF